MTGVTYVVGLQIFAGMDGDKPRQIGYVEVDAHDYYQTFAEGLRILADQLEAMDTNDDPV